MASIMDLETTALNAMAASPDGAITLSNLIAHLETRLGSTNEGSKSAQSPESQSFRNDVGRLLSVEQGSGSLLDRGLATVNDTTRMVRITAAGHDFVGH